MGGPGSGRKPSEETIIKRTQQPPQTPVGSDTYLPNLSGMKYELKNSKRGINTDDLAEGSNNLYFTEQKVKDVDWGTQGSILFLDAEGRIEEDNSNFFWDDTQNRLGVGTNSPRKTLDVSGSSEFRDIAQFSGTGTVPSNGAGLEIFYDSDADLNSGGGGSGASRLVSFDRDGSSFKDIFFQANEIGFTTNGTSVLELRDDESTVVPNFLGIGDTPKNNPNYTPLFYVSAAEAADFTIDGVDITSIARLIKTGGSKQPTWDLAADANGAFYLHNGQNGDGEFKFSTRRSFNNSVRWTINNAGWLVAGDGVVLDIGDTRISESTGGNVGIRRADQGNQALSIDSSAENYSLVIGSTSDFNESDALILASGAPNSNAMFAAKGTASNGANAFRLYNDQNVRLSFSMWGSGRSPANTAFVQADNTGATEPAEFRFTIAGENPMTFYTNDTERVVIAGDGEVTYNGGSKMDSNGDLIVQSYTDATRPSAGTPGKIIFNTDDGTLNVDDGTNWTDPQGAVT